MERNVLLLTVYIALLRGINVGGKKKIGMAELKTMLEAMGLGNVRTYIQSGNVLFQSGEDREQLRLRIEGEIERQFGMPVAVIMRTAEEWKRIVRECPFSPDVLTGKESIQITLVNGPVTDKMRGQLDAVQTEIDEFRIGSSEIYFLFRPNILDSKLAAGMQKLGGATTTRNLNTMNKLDAMADSLKD